MKATIKAAFIAVEKVARPDITSPRCDERVDKRTGHLLIWTQPYSEPEYPTAFERALRNLTFGPKAARLR